MEQFSIEKYLENPSRKVVTRRGNPVRIICTDRKHGEDELPVVFLEECNGGEFLLTCKSNGRSDNYDTQYDLFFADEEELTEFEGGLFSLVSEFWQKYALLKEEVDIAELVKENSKELLDLAKKELLKDFPMWKKCDDNLSYSHIGGLNNRYLIKNGYCIKISDLETLPKEE